MAPLSTSDAANFFEGSSEMHACCQALNWSKTPVGEAASWEPALKTIVRTVLSCPFPSILLWGNELVQIYNDGYRELMGNKHPAGLGQRTRDCWPEAWHVNESIFSRVLAGESLSFDHAHYTLNRSGKAQDAWFNVSYTPVRGGERGVLVIVIETTSLVLEQQIRQNAERHKGFLLSLSDAIRPLAAPHAIQLEAVSLLGKFLGANRAGYAESQHDPKLVAVTKNYTDGVKGIEGIYTYRDYGPELFDRLSKGETVVRPDIPNDITLDDTEKEAHAVLDLGATINVPLVKGGRLVAILFVHFVNAYDFSPEEIALIEETAERTWSAVERAKAEAELRESERQYRDLSIELDARVKERTRQLETTVADLKKSNANLQQFAYVASHDLQEPLRKILQFGGRLKNAYENGGRDGALYLERMLSASSRMSTLINDLLDFSRISALTGPADTISLNDVVTEVLTTLEVTINDQQASITVDPLPDIQGDASQLHQLFQNLISNALKFHRPGEVPVIRIHAGQTDAAALPANVNPSQTADYYHRIDVTDQGIGFDEQYLERIFQMFQRLHGKSEFEGTGIGLAICEKVVSNHGGAITASSRPGIGATFSIFLPAADTA